MKLAAAISALGLLALVAAAPAAVNARPPEHGNGGGDSRPHGRSEGGPHGGPSPDGRGRGQGGQGGQGQGRGQGGPGGYGPQGYNGQGGYGRGPQPQYSGRRIPLETVVGQMRRRFPGGHLLDADVQERGGRTVYHVHWATGDGRRIDYIVDAETGQILGVED